MVNLYSFRKLLALLDPSVFVAIIIIGKRSGYFVGNFLFEIFIHIRINNFMKFMVKISSPYSYGVSTAQNRLSGDAELGKS